jgi:hypothetical protein
MERLKTIAVNVLIVGVFSLLLVWGNTLYRQKTHFKKGEADLAGRNVIAAIAEYEAAIHMYTPFSGTVEKSAARLWEIGQGLEKTGDVSRALIAYRSLRSSFHAVTALNAPGTDWIARCDEKIAQLAR